jgi:anaerobic selenocysteine-containing dehydrogenase
MKVYSFCRNCSANCGTVFELADDKVVSHGRDLDNKISNGFICIKGEMAAGLMLGDEPRLTESQIRGENGTHQAVGNAEAIDAIASRLDSLVAQHGPRSVAMFYGTSAYRKSLAIPFARSFMKAIGSPNIFSTMSIDQSAHWVADCRMGVFATGRPYVQDVDALLIAGSNPVLSHQSTFFALPPLNHRRHIKDLQTRGGKLVVVDPRATETARLADLHLQPRPGYDAEIFACIIGIVLAKGWGNAAFRERFVTNLDALRHAVAPFTLQRTAARAGVEEDKIIEAARIVGMARKPSIGFATGVAMSRHPNTAAHMIEALNAICGGYAVAGDTVRHPGFFAVKATVERVIPANRSWMNEPKLRGGNGQLFGEFPSARLADEILTPGEGQIRALIVVGANPVMAFGEPDRLMEALSSLDLLVVIDPRMTETARLADYVIAPPLQYEVSDFTMQNDTKFTKPFIQYTAPVIAPPAGTIEEWRFLNALANRMGHRLAARTMAFGPNRAKNTELELTEDRDWQTDDLIRWYVEQAGLSFEAVRDAPHGYEPDVEIPIIAPAAEDDGARLDLCPPDVVDELRIIAKEDWPVEDGFVLVNRRIVETFNSAFRHSPITRRRHKTNSLYMHPDDMQQYGFQTDQPVNVKGEHGALLGYLAADKTLRRGVVAMTHNWGSPDPAKDPEGLLGGHTSRLVSMRPEHVQTIDGMPQHSALRVDIKRVKGSPRRSSRSST